MTMPIVEVKEIIHRDIRSIWEQICDFESYPEFMEPVLSVEKLDTRGNSDVVEWQVRLGTSVLKWTALETRFEDRYRVDFVQLDGDFERFCGFWQLSEIASDQTEATLIIEFEIGVPMLRAILDPVAVRALRDNSRLMLRSFERAAANAHRLDLPPALAKESMRQAVQPDPVAD
jgi:ribosome-associated toxin RatA of RatAB toxin-antitoxin module